MIKRFGLAAGIVIVICVGWFVTVIENKQSSVVLQADLKAQNNSGESGNVTIKDIAGSAAILLTLENSPDEVLQPAHIYSGTCSQLGPVKYTLTTPDAGESETDLDISTKQLKQQLPLAIDVKKSIDSPKASVACGDITEATDSDSRN